MSQTSQRKLLTPTIGAYFVANGFSFRSEICFYQAEGWGSEIRMENENWKQEIIHLVGDRWYIIIYQCKLCYAVYIIYSLLLPSSKQTYHDERDVLSGMWINVVGYSVNLKNSQIHFKSIHRHNKEYINHRKVLSDYNQYYCHMLFCCFRKNEK